jgi:hypothetical protein
MLRVCTDETSEVAFHRLIDSFRLSVCLWVISGAHFQVCPSCLEYKLPEVAGENWITVRDEILRHTMKPIHVVDKHFRYLASIVGVSHWNEVSILRKLIDDHQEIIVLSGRRQPINEVHRSSFPRS